MSNTILTIFMVLFLTQATFGKPIDNTSKSEDSAEEINDLTPKQQLLVYVTENLQQVYQPFVENLVHIGHNLLQNDSWVEKDSPKHLELKKNLTMFVERYGATNKEPKEESANTTELPEAAVTPASTFNLDQLIKDMNQHQMEFIKEFDQFVESFKERFEQSKMLLEKPLLDWYEKFITLTDVRKKLTAFNEFVDLAAA
ncbi:uncharacterized protein LOC135952335 [Calliphora vicina]|uniref:uncharacterized protein LOC135952335 n=1 Tax=Calliphora vicina TaxID=7373 RepID=UPI00325A5917